MIIFVFSIVQLFTMLHVSTAPVAKQTIAPPVHSEIYNAYRLETDIREPYR